MESPSATSEHTYLMSASPKARTSSDVHRSNIITTVGQRPACLVNASVTYVGNKEIYAFGGFDQYTDEVYNHVLRLNLDTRQWNLVDNYGDIPGVRMGHTATLWQREKILVFGGENEHRAYLSDIIIFDLKTAHWHQPELQGVSPRGRARHAAVIHDDKLFIVGGLSGHDNSTILDDFCYLDLRTWTWSRTWRFVPRYDHTSWIWGNRLWIFGGLNAGMERASDIWWVDLKNPIFGQMTTGMSQRSSSSRQSRPQSSQTLQATVHNPLSSGSVVQPNQSTQMASRRPPMAPGSISQVNFVAGPSIPSQAIGTRFHVYSSGCLLDFFMPAVSSSPDASLCALELDSMRWDKLVDGKALFNQTYNWHYCCLNEEGTKAWLLGCPTEGSANAIGNAEYLSDVLPINLRMLGLLGNRLSPEAHFDTARFPGSDSLASSHLSGIGADLSRMFDKSPSSGASTDFVVTADSDGSEDANDDVENVSHKHDSKISTPIHVHRLILEARWPHFARMIASQMAEFHSKKLHIPEPYSVVRAFLYYLYTDSIAPHPEHGPILEDVAGMLVMANCYDMPRLRALCRNRLGRELDVDHAATIWDRAGLAGEENLKVRAARFCMTHWGRVVRTPGFQNLRRQVTIISRIAKSSMMELCQEIDTEGRVVGADELEVVGGLGGAKFGGSVIAPNRRPGSASTQLGEGGDEGSDDDDDLMEFS